MDDEVQVRIEPQVQELPVPPHALETPAHQRAQRRVVRLEGLERDGRRRAHGPPGQPPVQETGQRLDFRQFRHTSSLPSATGSRPAELAKRLQVSAPTASVQAAALREAGLIATSRDGRQVRHTLTSIGMALLEANPEP
jgi:DNA-binding transcriptional ArsR family regulator